MKIEVITKMELDKNELKVLVRSLNFMRKNLSLDRGMYSINDKDGDKMTPFNEKEYNILKRIYFNFCED